MSDVPQDWIHEPPDMTAELAPLPECESVDQAIHFIRVTEAMLTRLKNPDDWTRYPGIRERAKAARLWLLDLEAK